MGAREPLKVDLDPGLTEFLGSLRRASEAAGASAWLVGGCVRDRLLGRPNPDFDVVVERGLGANLAAEFARQTGSPEPVLFERFGTAQVRWKGHLVDFAATGMVLDYGQSRIGLAGHRIADLNPGYRALNYGDGLDIRT